MKIKKCKQCKYKFGIQSERTNYSPYGLFCDEQCIKHFEESQKSNLIIHMPNTNIQGKNKLSREPIQINKDSWYYEEYGGITVVCELRDINQNYLGTTQTKIPWKKLLKSVENKYL